jgi:hypothetical protein
VRTISSTAVLSGSNADGRRAHAASHARGDRYPRPTKASTPQVKRLGLRPLRYALLGGALLSLAAAGWGGLVRIGWPWPPLLDGLVLAHGPLMVTGFIGTLIGVIRALLSLERIGFVPPALSVSASLVAITAPGSALAPMLGIAAALALLATTVRSWRAGRRPALALLGLAAAAWAIGDVLWLREGPGGGATAWWMAFTALAITGQRVDTDPRLGANGRPLLAAAVLLILLGALTVAAGADQGLRMFGLGAVALTAWAVRGDLVERSRRVGSRAYLRFFVVAMASAYFWLAVSGGLALVLGAAPYDAILHALFAGFVFSAIFAHAPTFLPGVLARAVVFRATAYVPLVLLDLAVVWRVAAALLVSTDGRRWSSLLIGLAVLLFVANTGASLRGRRPFPVSN